MRYIAGDLAIERAGIDAFSDFFPNDLFKKLQKTVLRQPERKRVIDVGPDERFPEPVATAADIIAAELDFPGINKAILKRYEPDEPSTAFDLHYDPEELQGGLVLVSLGSVATLTIASMNSGWVRQLHCEENMLVGMPPGYLHAITPPPPGETRPFMFLGHECPRVLSGQVEITAAHYH